MNIYQKILAVMREVQYLQKDDKVEFGSTKYPGLSEEKVTAILREQLIKQGLVVYPHPAGKQPYRADNPCRCGVPDGQC